MKLWSAVAFKIVQAPCLANRRKLVRMVEKRNGMCVWEAVDAVTLRVAANSHSNSG